MHTDIDNLSYSLTKNALDLAMALGRFDLGVDAPSRNDLIVSYVTLFQSYLNQHDDTNKAVMAIDLTVREILSSIQSAENHIGKNTPHFLKNMHIIVDNYLDESHFCKRIDTWMENLDAVADIVMTDDPIERAQHKRIAQDFHRNLAGVIQKNIEKNEKVQGNVHMRVKKI